MKKGFKMPGNMAQMMKQAQKMQKDLAVAQKEVETIEEQASAGGGVVKVTVDGRHDIVAIQIAPEVLEDKDPQMIQDLVMSAVNQANDQIRKKKEERLSAVTGGMSIPGM